MTYTREEALRDTAILHRLEKKKQQLTQEIDAEIEELERELDYLNARKAEVLKPITDEMNFIKQNLIAWHQAELEAGGDKTIKLPYANLKSRIAPQDYEKNDIALLEWVRVNAPEYIKIAEPTVAWGDLKKQIVVAGDLAILQETGEIIDGLAPKAREVKFDVEVL